MSAGQLSANTLMIDNKQHLANFLGDLAEAELASIMLHQSFDKVVLGSQFLPENVTVEFPGKAISAQTIETELKQIAQEHQLIKKPGDPIIMNGQLLALYLLKKFESDPSAQIDLDGKQAITAHFHAITETENGRQKITIKYLMIKIQDTPPVYEISATREVFKEEIENVSKASTWKLDKLVEIMMPIQINVEKDAAIFQAHVCQYVPITSMQQSDQGFFSRQLNEAELRARYGRYYDSKFLKFKTADLALARNLQTQAMSGVSKLFELGQGGALGDYATGAGKTFIQFASACPAGRALFVQPDNVLAKQFSDEFKKYCKNNELPLSDDDLLVIDSTTNLSDPSLQDKLARAHYVVMTMSVLEDKRWDGVFKNTLVCIDEADRMTYGDGATEAEKEDSRHARMTRLSSLKQDNVVLALTGTVSPGLNEVFGKEERLPAFTLRQAIDCGNCRPLDTEELFPSNTRDNPDEVVLRSLGEYFGRVLCLHAPCPEALSVKQAYITLMNQAGKDLKGSLDKDIAKQAAQQCIQHNQISQHTLKNAIFSGSDSDRRLIENILKEISEKSDYENLSPSAKDVIKSAAEAYFFSHGNILAKYYQALGFPEKEIQLMVQEDKKQNGPKDMAAYYAHIREAMLASQKKLLEFQLSARVTVALFGTDIDSLLECYPNNYAPINKKLGDKPLSLPSISDEANWIEQKLQEMLENPASVFYGQFEKDSEADKTLRAILADEIKRQLDRARVSPKEILDTPLSLSEAQFMHLTQSKRIVQIGESMSNEDKTRVINQMKLGLAMHTISDSTIATGVSDKHLYSVVQIVNTADDPLAYPPLPAQIAGRVIRGKGGIAGTIFSMNAKVLHELERTIPHHQENVVTILSHQAAYDTNYAALLSHSYAKSQEIHKKSTLKKPESEHEEMIKRMLSSEAPSLTLSADTHNMSRPETQRNLWDKIRAALKPKPSN